MAIKNRLRRKRVKSLFGTMDFSTGKGEDVWFEPHPAGVVFVGSGAGVGADDAEFRVWERDDGFYIDGPGKLMVGPYMKLAEAKYQVEFLVRAWEAGRAWAVKGL